MDHSTTRGVSSGMEHLLRAASRLIPVTVIVVGCTSGPGGTARTPSPATPASASVGQSCLVADTTAPTADTLYAIGVGTQDAGTSPPAIACGGLHLMKAPVVVAVAPPPGADLRDLLDEGMAPTGHRADVLVTRDAEVIAYAGRRADYLTAAMPWNSTYLLVAARPISASTVPSSAERDALARDAVTGDARGAVEPFAWRTDESCVAAFPALSSAPRPVVAYATGDAIARQLAERIVSLSDAAPSPAWVAAVLAERGVRIIAVPTDSIPAVLAAGRAAAAVTPLARDPRSPCGTRENALVPAGAIPLVDSRAHVIVRRGSGAALLVAPDGSLQFTRRGAR